MSDASSLAGSSTTPDNLPQFVHLDHKYKCPVCKTVLREAVQTPCGHRLCEHCVEEVFISGEPADCPAHEDGCEPLYKKEINRDASARREIRVLPVYCSFNNFGCQQQVPWKDLEKHTADCNFQPVQCPNGALGCERTIPRNVLEDHVHAQCQYRPVKCSYCHVEVPKINLQVHTENDCLAITRRCPNGCDDVGEMARDELQNHLVICPKKPIECEYSSVGCQFVGSRDAVAKHMSESFDEHLKLITLYTASMELQAQQTTVHLQEIEVERDSLQRDLQQQTSQNVQMKQMVENLKTSNKELKMKMVGQTERIIHLERKLEDLARKDVVESQARELRAIQENLVQLQQKVSQAERGAPVTGGVAAGRAQDLANMGEAMMQQLTQHDRQIGLTDLRLAELDLRFQVLETASYDGTLMWKIRDYTRRKQEAIAGKTLSLYSQPFYTSRYGYKLCARIYLNGDGMGKGSHMSLFFVVMRGEYDDLLPWPFQQKVTLMLLDQDTGQRHLSDTFRPDPTSNSFRKPTSEMNIASGCPLFCSHAVLETRTYIKDDTLFVKVVVETTSCPQP